MAKVELEMSEYNAIMEHKKDLQDALSEQKRLQDQIKTLTEEKVKAMEEAKMKVAVTTTIRHQYANTPKKPKDTTSRDAELSLRNQIMFAMGLDPSYTRKLNNTQMLSLTACYGVREGGAVKNWDYLRDIFFERNRYVTEGETSSTVLTSLDDVKADIKKDLTASMQDEIENAREVTKKFERLRFDAATSNEQASQAEAQAITLGKTLERATKEIELLNSKVSNHAELVARESAYASLVAKIHAVTPANPGIFGNKKYLERLNKVLDDSNIDVRTPEA